MNHFDDYFSQVNKYFKNKDSSENLIIYTYWNSEATYALQSLKKKYGYKLVSRIHGHDIYMKARPHEYMPLKSFFVYDIDKIYTITESAAGYLRENYGFNLNTIELSRLGVDDHSVISLPNSDNVFQIVSCSFLVEIKQVHKIISALEVVCGAQKDIDFIWNHIGGGKLYEVLLALARKKLSNIKNLKFNFLGVINNSEVYEFYKNNKVDVFINVSKSEGVPVSIMEAMSCHIPIIAPNVGGVSDMVKHEHNGLLLTKSCEVSEIINALSEIGFFKNRHVRENAYKVFRENFNAKSNYSGFIKNLMKLRAGALAPQRSKSPC